MNCSITDLLTMIGKLHVQVESQAQQIGFLQKCNAEQKESIDRLKQPAATE